MLKVIFVTAPTEEAEALTRSLLEERLIACANLIPKIKSLYWWEGEIESSTETLMILKAPEEHLSRLIDRVKELHSYEVPEILAIPVEMGLKAYLEWAESETAQSS